MTLRTWQQEETTSSPRAFSTLLILTVVLFLPNSGGCTPPKKWIDVAKLPESFESKSIVCNGRDSVLIGGQIDSEQGIKIRVAGNDVYQSDAAIYYVTKSGNIRRVFSRSGAGVRSLAVKDSTWWVLVRLDDDKGKRSSVILIRTDNNGNSWRTVSTVEISANKIVIDKNGIWLLASNNSLWRSIDKGKSWNKVDGVGFEGYSKISSDGDRFYLYGKNIWEFSKSQQTFSRVFSNKYSISALNDGVAIVKTGKSDYYLYDMQTRSTIGTLEVSGSPIDLSRDGNFIRVISLTDSILPVYVLLFESNNNGESWKKYRIEARSWYGFSALGPKGGGAAVSLKGIVSMP